jgi:hypothetical protein
MNFIKKGFNWCIENYKMLLAVGSLLAIFYYILQIIQNVGFTINIPKYFEFFNGLEPTMKMYVLAGANFVFTIVFVLLINSSKKKDSTKSQDTNKIIKK